MAGLNLNSTNHFNQWAGINTLNLDNPDAVNLRPVYQTRAGQLTSDLVLVGKVADRANADITGITGVKDGYKKSASELWGVITSNAFAFAVENNLDDLETQMLNASESKLLKTKDENFVSKCTNLKTLLTDIISDYPVVAITYFTAAQITAANEVVLLFASKFGAYGSAKADVNTAKKEFKNTWMPKMKETITVLEGLLKGTIAAAYPAFVESFQEVKKIVNAGKRDQGLLPEMVDKVTGLPFINTATFETVNYIQVKKQKIGKSDSKGLFKLMKLKVGSWTILFKVPGYVSQQIIVGIEAKKVAKIKVEMVAVVTNNE